MLKVKGLLLVLFAVYFATIACAESITVNSAEKFNAAGTVYDNVKYGSNGPELVISGGSLTDGTAISIDPTKARDQRSVTGASDGNGGLFLSWIDYRKNEAFGEIWVGYVDNTLATKWAKMVYVKNFTEPCSPPKVVKSMNAGACDGFYVVFKREGNLFAAKYKINGDIYAPWRDVVPLHAQPGLQQLEPALASDQNGGLVAVWQDYRSGQREIYCARFTADAINEWEVRIDTGGLNLGELKPMIVYDNNNGFIFAWSMKHPLTGFDQIYVNRLSMDGATLWGQLALTPARTSYLARRFSLVPVPAPATGAVIAWSQGGENNTPRLVYANYLKTIPVDKFTINDVFAWGRNGILYSDPNMISDMPIAACLADGTPLISWVVYTADLQAQGNFALLNASGAVQWQKMLDKFSIAQLEGDAANNIYAYGGSIPVGLPPAATIYPAIGKFTAAGNAIYGPVTLSSYPMNYTGYAGTVNGSGFTAVYVSTQYGYPVNFVNFSGDLIAASGTYTSPAWEADRKFKAWTNATYQAQGPAGNLSLQIRTGSSADIANRPWESVSSGGGFSSNGRSIQARFNYNSGTARDQAPVLNSYLLNYSTDQTLPTIANVKVVEQNRETILASGDFVSIKPTFKATLNDDFNVTTANMYIDNLSLNPTFYKISNTVAEVNGTSLTALPPGTHVLKVDAQDDAGNATSASYNVIVASGTGIAGGVAAAVVRTGNVVTGATIGFSLQQASDGTIYVRDITGKLVRQIGFSGVTGWNAVAWDLKDQKGSQIPNGIYLITVRGAAGFIQNGTLNIGK